MDVATFLSRVRARTNTAEHAVPSRASLMRRRRVRQAASALLAAACVLLLSQQWAAYSSRTWVPALRVRSALPAGSTITPELIERVQVPPHLTPGNALSSLPPIGAVASTHLVAGQLLDAAHLRQRDAFALTAHERVMYVPVPHRGALTDLEVGDVTDVLSVAQQSSVATVRVLRLHHSTSSGALGTGASAHGVSVAVDQDEAAAVAQAMLTTGGVTLARHG